MHSAQHCVALDAVYPAQPTRVADIRRDVVDVATRCGAGDTAVLHIKLAVSEAATNAILHAYRGDTPPEGVHVLVQRSDERLDVRIGDRGVGMSPRPDSPGLGMGLSLMAHEAEHFEVRAAPQGGTEVILRFNLD
jgi:serine/threonine-protein kinase RsbW